MSRFKNYKHEKESTPFLSVVASFFASFVPNYRDNLKQSVIKSVFLVTLVVFLVGGILLLSNFFILQHQNKVLNDARDIWYQTESDSDLSGTPFEQLKSENADFKGWIKIPGTKVDNPFYQTTDNVFYREHNQRKEESDYGALFLYSENVLNWKTADQNLVIYGHNMKDGSMFGSLKNLRSVPYFRGHNVIELTTENRYSTYKIYAVFILNAYEEDDNGYIYNFGKKRFQSEGDFEDWVNEAKERSLIETNVEVSRQDSFLTLVTGADDFENAQLVVMARAIRKDESQEDTATATPNPSPRYPKRWYDDKKIPYPYSGGKKNVS